MGSRHLNSGLHCYAMGMLLLSHPLGLDSIFYVVLENDELEVAAMFAEVGVQ